MKIHFIAIDDSVILDLALALHKNGHQISISYDILSKSSEEKLNKEGLLPKEGWFTDKINNNLDAVILGTHTQTNNPELIKAEELGVKIYSYPEFIYNQSLHKTRVVIAGSYGKTTITSMILHVLNYHEKEVDFLVGAQLDNSGEMVKITDDTEFIVLEGDEYPSSTIDLQPKFHLYKPTLALISGIAWKHTNTFPTKELYKEQFKIFIDSITNGGILMYNEEDEELTELVNASENPIRKMPYNTPEYVIHEDKNYLITEDGEMPLEVSGKHNMSNLAGAKWICQHMGIDEEDFYEAISTFTGNFL